MATTTRVSSGRRSRSRLLDMTFFTIDGDGTGAMRGHEPGKFCRPAIGAAGTRVRVTYEIIYKELYGNGNFSIWPDDCRQTTGDPRMPICSKLRPIRMYIDFHSPARPRHPASGPSHKRPHRAKTARHIRHA